MDDTASRLGSSGSPGLPARLLASWRGWIDGDLQAAGPAWLQWLWTLAFVAGIAAVFTVVGFASSVGTQWADWLDGGRWWRWYRVNFIVSLCIGVLIHGLFAALIPLVGPARIRGFGHRQRAAFFSGIPIVGVLLGWPLGAWLVSEDAVGWVRFSPATLARSAVVGATVSVVIFLVFNARVQQALAEKVSRAYVSLFRAM